MTRQYFLPLPSLTPEDLPILKSILDQTENAFNGNLDDSNITPKSLTAASLADATITGAKIAASTISPSNIVGTPQTASGTFVGDGTANRTISLGFTPRFVLLVRQSNGTEFTALGDGTVALTAYWRLAAGTQGSGTTDWQGVVAGGFKTGSNAGSTSNVSTETYWYVAWR